MVFTENPELLTVNSPLEGFGKIRMSSTSGISATPVGGVVHEPIPNAEDKRTVWVEDPDLIV